MKPFAEVEKVGALLGDLGRPWYVCGGWAIDLFLGRVTRAHKDVDVAVARDDQSEVQAYLLRRGWSLEVAHRGVLTPWAEGARLELPRHTVWCRHGRHDPGFVELLLNEIDDHGFRFRRDQSITLARERMSFEAAGLRVLAAEIVLLYKSNDAGEHADDFRRAAPSLSAEGRAWLKAALARLYAGHPWAAEL